MSEATGATAQTIHRLLKYDPREHGFAQNERRPLDAGMVIIDETSMLDVLKRHYPQLAPALAGVDNAFHPWKPITAPV